MDWIGPECSRLAVSYLTGPNWTWLHSSGPRFNKNGLDWTGLDLNGPVSASGSVTCWQWYKRQTNKQKIPLTSTRGQYMIDTERTVSVMKVSDLSRRMTTVGLIRCFTVLYILGQPCKKSSCDWLVCRSTHLSVLGLQSQLVPADGLNVPGLGQNLDPLGSLHQEGACGRLQPGNHTNNVINGRKSRCWSPEPQSHRGSSWSKWLFFSISVTQRSHENPAVDRTAGGTVSVDRIFIFYFSPAAASQSRGSPLSFISPLNLLKSKIFSTPSPPLPPIKSTTHISLLLCCRNEEIFK